MALAKFHRVITLHILALYGFLDNWDALLRATEVGRWLTLDGVEGGEAALHSHYGLSPGLSRKSHPFADPDLWPVHQPQRHPRPLPQAVCRAVWLWSAPSGPQPLRELLGPWP